MLGQLLKRCLMLLPGSHSLGLMQSKVYKIHALLLEAGPQFLVDLAKCAGHPAAPCSMGLMVAYYMSEPL